MISDADRRLVAGWAVHGLPDDRRTLDNAPIVLARLVLAFDELAASVDELLDSHDWGEDSRCLRCGVEDCGHGLMQCDCPPCPGQPSLFGRESA